MALALPAVEMPLRSVTVAVGDLDMVVAIEGQGHRPITARRPTVDMFLIVRALAGHGFVGFGQLRRRFRVSGPRLRPC